MLMFGVVGVVAGVVDLEEVVGLVVFLDGMFLKEGAFYFENYIRIFMFLYKIYKSKKRCSS